MTASFKVDKTVTLTDEGVTSYVNVVFKASETGFRAVMTPDQAWELATMLMVVAGQLSPENVE